MPNTPKIASPGSGREFDCFPAAVLGFIINPEGQMLLLGNPDGRHRWQVVNGALEHGETVVDGALREIAEEAGPLLKVRPLGCFHVESFALDPAMPPMVSIHYLFASSNSTVVPGSDMRGASPGWFTPEEIAGLAEAIIVPAYRPRIFERAFRCHTDWLRDQPDLQLSMPEISLC